MAFLLDTNTLIEAKNFYYGFDFCPGYWDWLIRENNSGNVFSIERVQDELREGNDELAKWAKERGRHFFLPMNAATLTSLGRVSNYVQNLPAPIDEPNKRLFLSKADPILIACAIAHGHTIITRETLTDSMSKRIKIPNICQKFSVSTDTPFEMLRQLGARFTLQDMPSQEFGFPYP